MQKISDVFFSTFIGEFVEILAQYKMSNTETGETYPLVIQGYILDADVDNYYMGTGPSEVTSLIKRDIVAHMSIMEEVDPELQILTQMPDPQAEEEIN